MNAHEAANRDFAKKLVSISLDDSGRVSSERVGDILEALRQEPPRSHRAVLKFFLTYLRRELAKTEARVEFAGQLSEQTLKEIHDNLKAHYTREIDLITSENPELIAGFRVHIADDVYDASVSGRLHALELATAQ